MRRILEVIDKISYWSGKIVSFLIIPLTLVICYSIVMRKFFSKAPDWGFEVPIFLFGIGIMVAGAEVLRVNEHISVDVIPRLLSAKAQVALKIFSASIIIIVCLFMAGQGYKLALSSTLINEHSSHQSSFNPPIWWYKWFIPLSAVLVLLQAIRHLVDEILVLLGKETENK
ncbi:TRAP transporter small permease subunit [Sporosarcina limicola]|uniref:TRAP-type mannitol/chloroaromatic compound transport system permease small subunit n=1 Tax=Sporosarcina limicola TaxID=34101 RepID=A0A927MLS3_9BACL|nr:TRAP transporter small permease subunit [Sporosarcina limicola]MBE1556705.1 TRAP-type mannitol/chloroaromatic compound transport system permease small subunit [Sporosarcina limicola]